jgi:septum formation protein
MTRIILASQSPRRAELLRMLGLDIEAVPADVDETWHAHEEPGAHAERLARAKAAVIAARRPDAVVIGSDTVVAIDGHVLGKPADEDDAVAMLMRLQGREHEVATGIAVQHNGLRSAVERVRVRFRSFDARTAAAYAATGEPLDKAGAYAVQGIGAMFIESIHGSYTNVVGLPLATLYQMLRRAGLDPLSKKPE